MRDIMDIASEVLENEYHSHPTLDRERRRRRAIETVDIYAQDYHVNAEQLKLALMLIA